MKLQALPQYPRFSKEVQDLVNEHRNFTDEPLLLAIYYKPDRDEQDIFLFEVIKGFGADAVEPNRELFEVTYASTAGFPMELGQRLHLVLTNPIEFEVAVKEDWALMAELRRAIDAGKSKTLYADPEYQQLRESVNA